MMTASALDDWWVYSTAVGSGTIMVECRNTGRLGVVKQYTSKEWGDAFYAPDTPYPWTEPDRVTVLSTPTQP